MLPFRVRVTVLSNSARGIRGLEHKLVLEQAVLAQLGTRSNQEQVGGRDGIATLRAQSLGGPGGRFTGQHAEEANRARNEPPGASDDPVIDTCTEISTGGDDRELPAAHTVFAV